MDPEIVAGRGLDLTSIGRGLEGLDPDIVVGRTESVVNWKGWKRHQLDPDVVAGRGLDPISIGRGLKRLDPMSIGRGLKGVDPVADRKGWIRALLMEGLEWTLIGRDVVGWKGWKVADRKGWIRTLLIGRVGKLLIGRVDSDCC